MLVHCSFADGQQDPLLSLTQIMACKPQVDRNDVGIHSRKNIASFPGSVARYSLDLSSKLGPRHYSSDALAAIVWVFDTQAVVESGTRMAITTLLGRISPRFRPWLILGERRRRPVTVDAPPHSGPSSASHSRDEWGGWWFGRGFPGLPPLGTSSCPPTACLECRQSS